MLGYQQPRCAGLRGAMYERYYRNPGVVVICFAIDCPASLTSVQAKVLSSSCPVLDLHRPPRVADALAAARLVGPESPTLGRGHPRRPRWLQYSSPSRRTAERGAADGIPGNSKARTSYVFY